MEIRKRRWQSDELNFFEERLEKRRRKTPYETVDPTIYVRNGEVGKYEPWGIRNYSHQNLSMSSKDISDNFSSFATGTLELPFPDGNILSVEHVNRVIILWGKEDKSWGNSQYAFLVSGICGIAPSLEDMERLHFAVETMEYDTKKKKIISSLMIYEGNTLTNKIENIVNPIRNAPNGGVGFSVVDGSGFLHMICEFDGMIRTVGMSRGTWFECEAKRMKALREKVDNLLQESIKQGYFEYYFSVDYSNGMKILESYLQRYNKPERIQNFFGDDDTKNYKVRIRVDDIDGISFLMYYGFSGYAIYEIPIDEYLTFVPEEDEREFFYRTHKKLGFHEEVLNNALSVSGYQSVVELQRAIEEYRKRSREIQVMLVVELFRRLNPMREMMTTEGDCASHGKKDVLEKVWVDQQRKHAKSKYDAEKKILLEKEELNIRWKGEYSMFKLARDLYKDAIYQYHVDWLGLQSIDVYIPSIKVGIEYQGIQHFEPVDFFGGKEGLEYRQELDEKKRWLCKENGISLLEWRYDDALTVKKFAAAIRKVTKSET